VSKATLLTLGGQADKLGEAIVKSKLLGVELSKVENIAESLLNFESSIGAELEAELLTGKNLNLERARLAALNGDIATVAEEIAKQIGTAADFTKMNVIQQEALAKAVGMTREDLAKSLMEREAMAKLSDQEGKTAQEKFNNLVKEVGLEEAKKRLGNEQLANMMAGQTIQERFTATIEKLQEVFVSLVEPLMPVVDAFASILKIVGPIAGFIGQIVKGVAELGKYLLPIYGLYYGISGLSKGIAISQAFITTSKASELGLGLSILSALGLQNAAEMYKLTLMTGGNKKRAIGAFLEQTMLGSIIAQGAAILKNIGKSTIELGIKMGILSAALATNAALTFGIGVAVAVAAALAGYAVIKAITANDMISSPEGYGKRTLLAPEGAIALNDKDTVIAGTNLGGGESKSIASPSINLAPLVERMIAVEAVLNQILTTTGNVYLDSTKVGTTQIMGTYRTQ
jgi:hypothetical protein